MDTFGHSTRLQKKKKLSDTVQGDRIKRQNIIHDIVFEFGSAAAWG